MRSGRRGGAGRCPPPAQLYLGAHSPRPTPLRHLAHHATCCCKGLARAKPRAKPLSNPASPQVLAQAVAHLAARSPHLEEVRGLWGRSQQRAGPTRGPTRPQPSSLWMATSRSAYHKEVLLAPSALSYPSARLPPSASSPPCRPAPQVVAVDIEALARAAAHEAAAQGDAAAGRDGLSGGGGGSRLSDTVRRRAGGGGGWGRQGLATHSLPSCRLLPPLTPSPLGSACPLVICTRRSCAAPPSLPRSCPPTTSCCGCTPPRPPPPPPRPRPPGACRLQR
jgi:hypothetical protein